MGKDLKILVADDVDFYREVMCTYFKRTPATILTATGGEDALRLIRSEKPDLAYLDVGMQDLSGIECCKQVKMDPGLKKIPVLLIFTPDRDASVEDVQNSGCDGFLRKPFGKEEFLNLGHRFLFDIERRERRVPCQMTVDFTIAGSTHQGRAHDLSLHGMYVEFREELPPGRLASISFMLPTISPHRLKSLCRINWINQGFPRPDLKLPQGFGLQFQSINDADAAIVKTYVDKYLNGGRND
jgi:CheY-like chemotaxis protein